MLIMQSNLICYIESGLGRGLSYKMEKKWGRTNKYLKTIVWYNFQIY